MTIIKSLQLLAVSSTLFLYSCGNNKEHIDFEPAYQSGSGPVQNDDYGILGKGETWKMWEKIFKACMKSEIFDNPFYFGVTNTIDLGSITDQHHTSIIKIIDTTIFSKSEISRLIKPGSPSSCHYTQELTMSLNVFLNSQFSVITPGSKDITTELNLAISTAKNTNVKVDGWQKDELVTGVLRDILNETTETKKLKFKKDLLTPGNIILVRVAKINGFSSEITTKDAISADLEAKLKSGIVANIGDTGAQAKFEFVNKTTIRIKSAGEFYVFGQYMKCKKVN